MQQNAMPTNENSIPLIFGGFGKNLQSLSQWPSLHREFWFPKFSTTLIISLISQNVRDYCQFSLKWSFCATSLRSDDEYWQDLFEFDVYMKKYKPEVQLAFKGFQQWSVNESGYF